MSQPNKRTDQTRRAGAGRRVALLSAVLVLGVTLAVAFLHHEELAVEYHLLRLRHSPDYLLSLVNKPEDSPGRQAVRAFLETAEGQRRLVELWVDLAWSRIRRKDFLPPENRAYSILLGLTASADVNSTLAVRILLHEPPRSSETTFSCEQTQIPALHALLPAVRAGDEWALEAYPHLRFRVSPPSDSHFPFQEGPVVVGTPAPEVIARVARRPDRLLAAQALTDIGPAGVPGLIELLVDTDATVRVAAARGLHGMSSALEETDAAIRALLERLADTQVTVRRAAARALVGILGPEFRADLSPLIRALNDTDSVVRARAAAALGNSRHAELQVTAALMRSLGDPDARVRFRAAQSLGDLGPGAASARPALQNVLEDRHGLVRHHAERALQSIGRP